MWIAYCKCLHYFYFLNFHMYQLRDSYGFGYKNEAEKRNQSFLADSAGSNTENARDRLENARS